MPHPTVPKAHSKLSIFKSGPACHATKTKTSDITEIGFYKTNAVLSANQQSNSVNYLKLQSHR